VDLKDILTLIDDIEEISIFKSYRYNIDCSIQKTKDEFIKSKLYEKYKDCKVKGIYPEENIQCIIIL